MLREARSLETRRTRGTRARWTSWPSGSDWVVKNWPSELWLVGSVWAVRASGAARPRWRSQVRSLVGVWAGSVWNVWMRGALRSSKLTMLKVRLGGSFGSLRPVLTLIKINCEMIKTKIVSTEAWLLEITKVVAMYRRLWSIGPIRLLEGRSVAPLTSLGAGDGCDEEANY